MQSSTRRSPEPIWLVLMVFVSARLMMLMTWPVENLSLYGDYVHSFGLGALSRTGSLPYVQYWSEYPPLFPFLNLVLYRLSGEVFKNYALLLSLTLLVFETCSLYVLYRLAGDVWGKDRAAQIGWIYAALFVPALIWLGTFEAITALFVLAALWALRRGWPGWAGVFIGLGAITKLWPLVFVLVVWRERGWRSALTSGLIVLLVCVAVIGPLLAISPDFTLASLQAQLSKSSWQTVWALLDGNLTNTGNFGPLDERFDPARATATLHNSSRLPIWLTFVPFAALGLFMIRRPRRPDGRDMPIFAALIVTLFLLWSKGWSPQWQMVYIPLVLLSLAPARGVLFVVALGFVNILEWPVILSRGFTQLLPLTIGGRTLIFALLGWELYRELTADSGRVGIHAAEELDGGLQIRRERGRERTD
jgi:hypothetical protein